MEPGGNEVQGFHHVGRSQVRALEEVAAFYREVLGLGEIERHHAADGQLRSIWLDVGGGGFLALERVQAAPAPHPEFRGWVDRACSWSRCGSPRDHARDHAEPSSASIPPLVHETRWTMYVRDPRGTGWRGHHPDGG